METSLKRKFKTLQQTPVSQLQELCTKQNVPINFELIHNEKNSKMFSYLVKAFDMVAKGSGQSKAEAKHEASANLIAQLISKDRFGDILHKVPEIPRPLFDDDAITILLDTCVQRNWPIATFEVKKIGGESHSPIFNCVCQVSKIQRIGKHSTKNGARQIAAREVLEVIHNLDRNKETNPIPTIVSEPPEKIFCAYYKIKGVPPKSQALKILDRHKFYLQLAEADRKEAKEILMNTMSVFYAKDRVDLALAALHLEYNVSSIPNHQMQFKYFHLLGNHDCVIVAREEDLYNKVIDYLRTMLNLQEFEF